MADQGLTLDVASISELGARAANQDAVGRAQQAGLQLFAVADGTGGHHGGEVAARIVIDSVIGGFNAAPALDEAALRGWLAAASSAVAQGQHEVAERRSMSATAAVLVIDLSAGTSAGAAAAPVAGTSTGAGSSADARAGTARAIWAHLGDTRIYLFRDARVHATSKDHSLTQQLIDAGFVAADQQRTHAQRNILLAAVGAEGEIDVDVSEVHALRAGDALLICTDGLWEWVLEAQMEAALALASGSAAWLDALCALAAPAAAASGKPRDNFSAYAIMVTAA